MTKEEKREIKRERMIFTKDKIPSALALLAIVFNVLYFVCIYRTNLSSYYSYVIGLSVLTNLLFMLAAFLCSEGVKRYKKSYGIAMIVIGVIEIARIFVYPLMGINKIEPTTSLPVMATDQFVRTLIYLLSAAGLLIGGGILSILNSLTLEKTLKEKQEAVKE